MPLRIVFAGTPDFAATSLAAVLDSSHEVVGVLCQPDRPAGRGKKIQPGPVRQLVERHSLPLLQPETLKDPDLQEQLARWAPDVMVVVAYGLIIPASLLKLPGYGCINVHGSLLPRWRGAAPVQRAIAAGDRQSGVTIMAMDEGLDTGPMLLTTATEINEDDTGGSLYERIATLGAESLIKALDDLPALLEQAQPQPLEGITYASKLTKDEARLDWRQPASQLHDRIRAYNPWPVAWTFYQKEPLRIWQSRRGSDQCRQPPGTLIRVMDDALEVACGDASLHLTQVQLPGKKPMTVTDLLRGHTDRFVPGQVFSSEH